MSPILLKSKLKFNFQQPKPEQIKYTFFTAIRSSLECLPIDCTTRKCLRSKNDKSTDHSLTRNPFKIISFYFLVNQEIKINKTHKNYTVMSVTNTIQNIDQDKIGKGTHVH